MATAGMYDSEGGPSHYSNVPGNYGDHPSGSYGDQPSGSYGDQSSGNYGDQPGGSYGAQSGMPQSPGMMPGDPYVPGHEPVTPGYDPELPVTPQEEGGFFKQDSLRKMASSLFRKKDKDPDKEKKSKDKEENRASAGMKAGLGKVKGLFKKSSKDKNAPVPFTLEPGLEDPPPELLDDLGDPYKQGYGDQQGAPPGSVQTDPYMPPAFEDLQKVDPHPGGYNVNPSGTLTPQPNRFDAFKSSFRNMMKPQPVAPSIPITGTNQWGEPKMELKPFPPKARCRMSVTIIVLLILGLVIGIILTAFSGSCMTCYAVGPTLIGLSIFALCGKVFLTKFFEDDPFPRLKPYIEKYDKQFNYAQKYPDDTPKLSHKLPTYQPGGTRYSQFSSPPVVMAPRGYPDTPQQYYSGGSSSQQYSPGGDSGPDRVVYDEKIDLRLREEEPLPPIGLQNTGYFSGETSPLGRSTPTLQLAGTSQYRAGAAQRDDSLEYGGDSLKYSGRAPSPNSGGYTVRTTSGPYPTSQGGQLSYPRPMSDQFNV